MQARDREKECDRGIEKRQIRRGGGESVRAEGD